MGIVINGLVVAGALVGLQIIFRKTWKTFLAIPLIGVYLLVSSSLLIAGDVVGEMAYWGGLTTSLEPEKIDQLAEAPLPDVKPLLLLLEREGKVTVGIRVNVALIARLLQVVNLPEENQEQKDKKGEIVKTVATNHFGLTPDGMTDEHGRLVRDGVLKIYKKLFPTLEGRDLEEVTKAGGSGGWDDLGRQYHRVLKLDMDEPLKAFAALDKLEFSHSLKGDEGKAPLEISLLLRKQMLLECLDSQGCGDMIVKAMESPSLLLESVNGRTDVDAYLYQEENLREGIVSYAGSVPGYPLANFLVGIGVAAMPIALTPATERPRQILDLLRQPVLEIYPRTPIVKLVFFLVDNMPEFAVDYAIKNI